MTSQYIWVTMVTVCFVLGISAKGRPQPWHDRCKRFMNRLGRDTNFEVERIPQMRNFVGSYSYDVGTCPLGTCKTKIFKDESHPLNSMCPDDGFITPLTKTETADLGEFGTSTYEYVVKCICEEDTGIDVHLEIVDAETGELIDDVIYILFDDDYVDKTDNGFLETTLESSVNRIVIRAVDDDDGLYLDAIKVIDIPENFHGPINVMLQMVKIADPVEIDSTVPNTLYLSDNVLTHAEGVSHIEIEADSFELVYQGPNGRPRTQSYDGPVLASVTFLDSNTVNEDILPGRFQTVEGDSVEYLISKGIVSFDFRTEDGQELRLRNEVTFKVSDGMRLWSLNPVTGIWEPLGESLNREKRQLTEDFLVSIENRQWINVDKLLNAPLCYFKSRIFYQITGNEIPSSLTASFRPDIVAYTTTNQRLRIYPAFTHYPSDTCYQVYCPDNLIGFISMTSMETVSIGGVPVPFSPYLIPKYIDEYIPPIESLHAAIHYEVYPESPGVEKVFVNFTSSQDGPFYLDLTDCESSTVDDAAFHFYKLPLPSYDPIPDDTELCTARVLFRNGRDFYSYIDSVDSLPNITAISLWETDDGNDLYYYTDTTQLLKFDNVTTNEEFVFACITYRCSESSNPTLAVYLDIGIPNVTHFYNTTVQDGTIMEYNYTVLDFQCYGECIGPFCQQNPDIVNNNNDTSIEGSFFPADDIEPLDLNDCLNTDSIDNEFDYSFECYAYLNGDGAQQRFVNRLERRKLFK